MQMEVRPIIQLGTCSGPNIENRIPRPPRPTVRGLTGSGSSSGSGSDLFVCLSSLHFCFIWLAECESEPRLWVSRVIGILRAFEDLLTRIIKQEVQKRGSRNPKPVAGWDLPVQSRRLMRNWSWRCCCYWCCCCCCRDCILHCCPSAGAWTPRKSYCYSRFAAPFWPDSSGQRTPARLGRRRFRFPCDFAFLFSFRLSLWVFFSLMICGCLLADFHFIFIFWPALKGI